MTVDERVLDVGLGLAMAFGRDWLTPIQSRLAEEFPELSSTELDAYDRACRDAMRSGHELVAPALREAAGEQEQAFRLFRDAVRAQFAWVSDENVSRLFSQGCYYALK